MKRTLSSLAGSRTPGLFSLDTTTGTTETNTRVETTEGLLGRFIELGRRFDYFAHPDRDHGLSEGRGTTVRVHMLITRYLIEQRPPGPC